MFPLAKRWAERIECSRRCQFSARDTRHDAPRPGCKRTCVVVQDGAEHVGTLCSRAGQTSRHPGDQVTDSTGSAARSRLGWRAGCPPLSHQSVIPGLTMSFEISKLAIVNISFINMFRSFNRCGRCRRRQSRPPHQPTMPEYMLARCLDRRAVPVRSDPSKPVDATRSVLAALVNPYPIKDITIVGSSFQCSLIAGTTFPTCLSCQCSGVASSEEPCI